MVISKIAEQVVNEKGAVLLRPRDPWVKGQVKHYDMKPLFTGNKRHWIMLDIMTASALNACYQALSEPNQAKWDTIPLARLVNFAWKHVS